MRIENTLYFDYQASTPLDSRVLDAMTPFFVDCFANPHSADHAPGWRAAQAVEDAAGRVAKLIGADPDEIIFTSGATESNNLALLGLARRGTGGRRKRVLVSTIEHKCVLAAARAMREQLDIEVEYLPVNKNGQLVISALEERIDEDVLALSLIAVNNEIGTIQDIKSISEITQSNGVILHCDAAQAVCAVDLRDSTEFVDLLSLSAHKMYGPKGIGALFIRRDLQDRIEPIIYGGGQQNGLRSGTVPVGLCVGMGAAADLFISEQAELERETLRQRRDRFVQGLQELPWPIFLNGPVGLDRHPGNANVRFDGCAALDILGVLQPHLAASTGSACTSGISEPSHVLRAIGLSEQEAEASIRFSMGRRTTDADVEESIALIHTALQKLSDGGLVQSA